MAVMHTLSSSTPPSPEAGADVIVGQPGLAAAMGGLDRSFVMVMVMVRSLSGRSTTDALIRAGNTSTLRPGRRSAPPGRRTSVGSTAPTVLLPVHFVPLPGARGRHRLQHLLHAGESRGADRGRPRLPA